MDRTPESLECMVTVPTVNARGPAMSERCQQAVYESPEDPAKFQCKLRVRFLCHAAYDRPKKFFWAVRLGRRSPRDACSRHFAEHVSVHVGICVDSLCSRGLPPYQRMPWELEPVNAMLNEELRQRQRIQHSMPPYSQAPLCTA